MKKGDANRCLLLAGRSVLHYFALIPLSHSPFIAIIPDEKPINSPTEGWQVLADGGLPSQ